MNEKLTPERLFSEPALRLEQPSQLKFSPSATYVSYLQQNPNGKVIINLCWQAV